MSFFNNKQYGETFAKDILKTKYGKNTVALDTWLTLGQTTRTQAKTYFGVLKSEDDDATSASRASEGASRVAKMGKKKSA